MKKPYITQQESYVPEVRRPVNIENKIKLPKKRGRRKSIFNLKRMLFMRALYKVAISGKRYTREEFAAAIGLNPLSVNTMSAAFIRTGDEENQKQRELQEKLDKYYSKPHRLTTVPLLEAENIIRRDFEIKLPLSKQPTVSIAKEPKYGERMHYFGFVMPDNCMLHDGICQGDKIVAARNLRPGDGDLVACRIPGTKVITVRRYACTCNPSLFDLYEGGTINPFIASEIEKLIYGVVVGLEREYWGTRLPQPWEPVRK